MWDEFVDHTDAKRLREPDDYEWEPTPHDDVLEKAKQHYTPRPHSMERKRLRPQIYTDENTDEEESGFRDSGFRHQILSICVHLWLLLNLKHDCHHPNTRTSGAATSTMSSRLDGELLEVSMGPQHPSTHGVFRMNVALEGRSCANSSRSLVTLHRNHEKIGENATYLSSMPYNGPARLLLLDDEQLGLRAQCGEARRQSKFPNAPNTCASFSRLTRSKSRIAPRFLLSDMGAWARR